MSDKRLPVLFGLHNHQPLGNFDHVIERLTKTCYLPFLGSVSRTPKFRFSLHISGPLLLWWEENQPEMLDLIGQMVSRNQVELLSGGFYEPVLASIPREDRREQIARLNNYIKERFGYSPKGLWLTERVWEAQILGDLIDEDIEYLLVDDRHFLVSGFSKQQLHGYFVTEAEGHLIRVFPIDETLRYLIPFRPVVELEGYLKSVAVHNGNMAIYVDDGEKFGAWPGTYKWIYQDGWLDDFLERALSWGEEFVNWTTFSAVMQEIEPSGICYLPTCSYEEMEEWALPADKILRFQELIKSIGPQARQIYRPFLRGGHWKNFFVKYPESNRMHKRAIMVSKMASKAWPFDPEARDLALSAQCNDAYWHGIFGGLYLPHLRIAVWKAILKAEARLRKGQGLKIYVEDTDLDGRSEVRAVSDRLSLVIKPSYGGQVVELSDLKRAHNFCNTLTRRHEAYHEDLKEAIIKGSVQETEGESSGVSSIHHLAKVPDKSLMDDLIYDWYQRHMFIEHLFDPWASLADYRRCDFREWGDFANQPFEYQVDGNLVILWREGGVYQPWTPKKPIILKKIFTIKDDGLIRVEYHIENRSVSEEIHCRFGVEWNLFPGFLSVGDGHFLVNGKPLVFDRPWEAKANGFEIVDRGLGTRLALNLESESVLWAFPIETVAQSEKGYEKTLQGFSIMAHWPLDLLPGENLRLNLRLCVSVLDQNEDL